jgi:hypothetical protein
VIRRAGEPVLVLEASAHAPEITVLEPDGGESWADAEPHQVHWHASDADGDTLTASVHYSRDGGESWRLLASGLAGDHLDVGAGLLPGSTQALVRVQVSDGLATAEDSSDAVFSVAEKAPAVWLLSPADGALLPAGQAAALDGLATDPEDGPLPDEALRWTSDRDGELGAGSALTSSDLSPGRHVLTLTAADLDGMSSAATVSVTVCALTATAERTTFPAAGGSGVLRIEASAAACPWEVTVEGSWLAVAGAKSGAGDAELAFTVAPTFARDGREGAIWVAGERVRIVQDGVVHRPRRQMR